MQVSARHLSKPWPCTDHITEQRLPNPMVERRYEILNQATTQSPGTLRPRPYPIMNDRFRDAQAWALTATLVRLEPVRFSGRTSPKQTCCFRPVPVQRVAPLNGRSGWIETVRFGAVRRESGRRIRSRSRPTPTNRQDRAIYDVSAKRPFGWPAIAIVRFSAVIASRNHASNALG